MTNRELIIKQMTERDDDVLVNFMCPYIPGEDGAGCVDPEAAKYNTHCKDCLRKWMDEDAR